MQIYLAELFGTFLFMYIGLSINANMILPQTKGSRDGVWLTTSLGWGLAILLPIMAFGSISGAHFNPAVSLVFFILGEINFVSFLIYTVMQNIGAFIAATFVIYKFGDHFKLADDETSISVFGTGPSIKNYHRNFFSEFIGTFILMFFILTVASGETYGAPFIAIAIISIGMGIGGKTGFALNPARDFGPRLAYAICTRKNSNWHYAWVPLTAPMFGSAVALGVYYFLFNGF